MSEAASPSRPTSTTPSARPPRRAGEIAGPEGARIINEPWRPPSPTVWTRRTRTRRSRFDCGGGTVMIVSVLELGDGVFEVKSTDGDTHLGGDDFDQRDHRLAGRGVRNDGNIDRARTDGPAAPEGGRREGQIELSSSTHQHEVNLPTSCRWTASPKHLVRTLSRAKFERWPTTWSAHHRPCDGGA